MRSNEIVDLLSQADNSELRRDNEREKRKTYFEIGLSWAAAASLAAVFAISISKRSEMASSVAYGGAAIIGLVAAGYAIAGTRASFRARNYALENESYNRQIVAKDEEIERGMLAFEKTEAKRKERLLSDTTNGYNLGENIPLLRKEISLWGGHGSFRGIDPEKANLAIIDGRQKAIFESGDGGLLMPRDWDPNDKSGHDYEL